MTDKIDYTKKPLTIAEQIARLKQRGLIFDDESEATSYLFNISYYRLRAYTYPFQENGEDCDHNFTRKDIHFEDIIALYCFDRRLRSLIFNAIEKIEVAVRTKVVQVYAESTGNSHWYDDESLYRFGYDDLMEHIEADVNRSNEDFIKHYNSKYNDPPMPPSWMALEVVSFTTLSRLFQSLKLDKPQRGYHRTIRLEESGYLGELATRHIQSSQLLRSPQPRLESPLYGQRDLTIQHSLSVYG